MSTTPDSREQFYVVLALDEYEDTNLLATCKHYSLIVSAIHMVNGPLSDRQRTRAWTLKHQC